MFTPATSASSTSSPRVMRPKASSTHVRGPPFLYLNPLAEEMTTGFTEVMTAGPWPKAGAVPAPAARRPAVPVFMKSRRLTLCGIALLSMTNGVTASLSRPFSAGWEVPAARPEEREGGGPGQRGPPFAMEADARPREARGARPARSEPRREGGHLARPGGEGGREWAGQELRFAADGGGIESQEVGGGREGCQRAGGGKGYAGRQQRAAQIQGVPRMRVRPARGQHPRLLDVPGGPDADGFAQEPEDETGHERPGTRAGERDYDGARHPSQRDAEPRRQRRSGCARPRPAGGRSPSGPLPAGSRASRPRARSSGGGGTESRAGRGRRGRPGPATGPCAP